MNDSWVEKFRLKKLIEIVLSLKKCIEIKNIPPPFTIIWTIWMW